MERKLQNLAYACYDYPHMVEDMVETSCVLVEDYLDQVLPHVDFDFAAGWEDICYKSGPLVSRKFFREVVVPRYKRIHRKLQVAGIDLWYIDCDGDLRPILPDMLEGWRQLPVPLRSKRVWSSGRTVGQIWPGVKNHGRCGQNSPWPGARGH